MQEQTEQRQFEHLCTARCWSETDGGSQRKVKKKKKKKTLVAPSLEKEGVKFGNPQSGGEERFGWQLKACAGK